MHMYLCCSKLPNILFEEWNSVPSLPNHTFLMSLSDQANTLGSICHVSTRTNAKPRSFSIWLEAAWLHPPDSHHVLGESNLGRLSQSNLVWWWLNSTLSQLTKNLLLLLSSGKATHSPKAVKAQLLWVNHNNWLFPFIRALTPFQHLSI